MPLYDYGDARLRRFHSRLGAADTRAVRVICLGDSVTEGIWASSRARHWPGVLSNIWRRRFGGALHNGRQPSGADFGTGGYFATRLIGTNTVGELWTHVGTPTALTVGLSRRGTLLDAAADISTLQGPSSDRYWVHYTQGPTRGSFQVLDSPDNVTYTLRATVDANNVTVKGGRVFDSGALTRTAFRWIRIIPVNTGTNPVFNVALEGATVFNGNYAAGVQVYEAGYAGANSSTFISPNDTQWDDGFDTLDPDLVIVAIGINDVGASITPTTFASNMTALVAQIRAANPAGTEPSIALVAQPSSNSTDTATPPWSNYVDQVYAVARNTGCAVVDLFRALGPLAGDPHDLAPFDETHLGNNGQRMVANVVDHTLAPPIPGWQLLGLDDVNFTSLADWAVPYWRDATKALELMPPPAVGQLAAYRGAFGWTVLNPSRVLNRIVAQTAFATSVAENTLFTVATPAPPGLIVNDHLKIVALGDILQASGAAVNYTFRFKIGATTVHATAAISVPTVATQRRHWRFEADVFLTALNDLDVSVQLDIGAAVADTWQDVAAGFRKMGRRTEIAEDLTTTKNLVLTCQMGTSNASADVRVQSVTTELISRGSPV